MNKLSVLVLGLVLSCGVMAESKPFIGVHTSTTMFTTLEDVIAFVTVGVNVCKVDANVYDKGIQEVQGIAKSVYGDSVQDATASLNKKLERADAMFIGEDRDMLCESVPRMVELLPKLYQSYAYDVSLLSGDF